MVKNGATLSSRFSPFPALSQPGTRGVCGVGGRHRRRRGRVAKTPQTAGTPVPAVCDAGREQSTLSIVEIALLQADVVLRVEEAEYFEEVAAGRPAGSRPVVGLDADRQAGLLVEIRDTAIAVELA